MARAAFLAFRSWPPLSRRRASSRLDWDTPSAAGAHDNRRISAVSRTLTYGWGAFRFRAGGRSAAESRDGDLVGSAAWQGRPLRRTSGDSKTGAATPRGPRQDFARH